MAPTSSLLPSLVLLLAACLGRTAAEDGCIHMPIIHSTNSQYFGKRAVSLSLSARSDVAYYANLEIGSPAQSVFVQLDTGSFELWVNPQCSALEGADASFCATVGHYNTSQSTTADSLGTGKTLNYGIGSANITYFKDDIAFPGSSTSLKSVQFGVASSSRQEFSGVMGIGYGQGIATSYRNFVDELRAQNATQVKAFTVALGSKEDGEGVVVFGGVDTSRFAGTLARLPIIPARQSPDQVPRYWVDMEALVLSPPNGSASTYPGSSIPVFLDTGSTMTLLPTALADQVARDFGASGADGNGFYQVGCDLEAVNGTLDFVFAGTTVSVPYSELLRKVEGTPPSCFLGISPSDQFTLLGDTFMRSAYVVFDLENDVVWMTQSANCGSTPAALVNMSAMDGLTGNCGVGRVVNPATTAVPSGSVATPSVDSSGDVQSSGGGSSSFSTASVVTATPVAVVPGGSADAASTALRAVQVGRGLGLGLLVSSAATLWFLV